MVRGTVLLFPGSPAGDPLSGLCRAGSVSGPAITCVVVNRVARTFWCIGRRPAGVKFLERDFSEGPAVHDGRDTDVEMEVGVDTGVEMYVTVWTSRQSGAPFSPLSHFSVFARVVAANLCGHPFPPCSRCQSGGSLAAGITLMVTVPCRAAHHIRGRCGRGTLPFSHSSLETLCRPYRLLFFTNF